MSVTAPQGFAASGTFCGIKPHGALDLALVATDPATAVPAAAVFTSNKAAAAPVQVSRLHLASTGGRVAAVVLNSGCANAATGAAGRQVAEATCAAVAGELGVAPEEVLVCSTGLIGIPLPFRPISEGVPGLVASRNVELAGGGRAAQAIMTTDTKRKEVVVEAASFTVGGMAKGAAMLAPNMATMLAVLTTDAAADPPVLQSALRAAVSASFNEMTVDGCTSTNDTVIVLANGRAGPASEDDLADALHRACSDLASQMVADAEGATKFVTVRVVGAASAEEAAAAARRVADSQLVKCSLYGSDPYWGRVVSELGTAGVAFDIDSVSVFYGDYVVCRGGIVAEHDQHAIATYMAGKRLEITCDLGIGAGEASVLTTDLSHLYIDENMRTS